MGVYVKGMEMPKCCAGCDAEEYYENSYGDECGFFCPFGDKAYTSETRELKRLDDCPIIPIPPHGRLIDADALMNEFKILQSGREIFGMELDSSFLSSGQELSTEWYCVEDAIEDAPTIIEAEEGE